MNVKRKWGFVEMLVVGGKMIFIKLVPVQASSGWVVAHRCLVDSRTCKRCPVVDDEFEVLHCSARLVEVSFFHWAVARVCVKSVSNKMHSQMVFRNLDVNKLFRIIKAPKNHDLYLSIEPPKSIIRSNFCHFQTINIRIQPPARCQ